MFEVIKDTWFEFQGFCEKKNTWFEFQGFNEKNNTWFEFQGFCDKRTLGLNSKVFGRNV